MSRLLTAREVAQVIGVSTETVLRWTRRGELPAIRLPGGAIRFREDDLDGWLEERATPRRGSANHPGPDAARREGYCSPSAIGIASTAPTTP
jgi:excisionase family DNA binding protein